MSVSGAPRDAATVILLRPRLGLAGVPTDAPVTHVVRPDRVPRSLPAGAEAALVDYEVFMVRRPATSAFAPDAWVFPGGTLRPDDWPPAGAPVLALSPEAAHARLGGREAAGLAAPNASLAIWIAALRELFEEAGVLMAYDRAGDPVAFDEPSVAARFTSARAALADGALSLWALAAREALTLAPEHLRYWAHWITPEAARRRYDTRFFLACLPPRQEALYCAVETTDGRWVAPHVALARHAAGDFPLVFATRAHLERLASLPTFAALSAHAERKPVVTVLPRLEPDGAGSRVVIPAEVRECW